MLFRGIDEFINNYGWENSLFKLEVDKTVEQKFPHLHKKSGHLSGYTEPMHCMHTALCWLWLKWHQSISIDEIRDTLRPVIARAVQANSDTNASSDIREDHDSFLMQLSILTGSNDLMRMVAESVIPADIAFKEYQYFHAWTGILKYRILGNEDKVIEQHEIMKKWKSVRVFEWPTNKIVDSFVKRDWKSFNKELKRCCERHWVYAERDKAFVNTENGEQVLDLKKKHNYFFWPWVEGAFAKLAYRDGAEIKYDSPWLPLSLVKAIDV
jgi:hypothetical protein